MLLGPPAILEASAYMLKLLISLQAYGVSAYYRRSCFLRLSCLWSELTMVLVSVAVILEGLLLGSLIRSEFEFCEW